MRHKKSPCFVGKVGGFCFIRTSFVETLVFQVKT
nr:MAG TPA: hypothetical protein [Bacteriophage sp.]DAG60828.1 MAG TPA: hypothetical protein [Caudoviricetes sp.]